MPTGKWSVIVPPSAFPVQTSYVMMHLHIDHWMESPYINELILIAVDYAQDALGMSLMPQTIQAVFNAEDVELSPPVRDYPWDPLSPLGTPLGTPSFATWGTYNRAPIIKLPRGPVQSILSITDGGGNPVTDYALEQINIGDRIRFMGTAAYPLTVTYTAGFPGHDGTSVAPSCRPQTAVPAAIRGAIMAHVATLYYNRESANASGSKEVPHSLSDFYRLKARKIPCG
jgi:hypothetical protein